MKKPILLLLSIALFIGACSTGNIKEIDENYFEEHDLSFDQCVTNLYLNDKEAYHKWEDVFTTLFPDFHVYDAGSHCWLSDDTQLVSFSFFDFKGDGMHLIAWFDEFDNLLDYTKDFHCDTIGDLGFAQFDSIEDNRVNLSCKSGDAGWIMEDYYILNMDNFSSVYVNQIFVEVKDE